MCLRRCKNYWRTFKTSQEIVSISAYRWWLDPGQSSPEILYVCFSFLLLPFHSAILDWKYFPFFQLEYCFVIEIHFFLFLIGISSYYSIWKFCMLIGIFPFHYSNTSLFRICVMRLKFEWLWETCQRVEFWKGKIVPCNQ